MNPNTQPLSKQERNALYTKRYKEKNKEKLLAYQKQYLEEHKQERRSYSIQWYYQNKEKARSYQKQYLEANKERCIARELKRRNRKENKERKALYNKQYLKQRIEKDPLFAMKVNLRKAVRNAFKRIGSNKPTNTLALLGCSWKEAKNHFEALFQEGMTWSNHGEWEIDHIRPVSDWKEDELHLMNHISNLQPLWKKANRQKSGKLIN